MKTLYLIRHAKSDWSDPALSDFDRPLNKRGVKNAPFMGKILSKQGVHPDRILTSPALRAKMTAESIAQKVGYDISDIVYERSLYLADPETIESVLHSLSPSTQNVFLIGHNPGLTEFAEYLTGQSFGNIPTCGIVAAALVTDSWKEVQKNSAKLLFFDYPKKHSQTS